jgi:hypothetical protein
MSNHVFVKPAEGLKIPDLDLRDNLPPEGRNVVDSDYWRRREAEKSVTISAPVVEKQQKGK